MPDLRPVLPLADNEIACLKRVEAFMHGRVAIEKQIISGLQALLEDAPPLPEHRLSWHCAFEKLFNGTRDELQIRMEELESLEARARVVAASITKAERYIRDLNLEFKNIIELAESAKSAQVAAATSHKKSRLAENTLPKNGLINHFLAMPLSAQRAQEMSAGSKYYRQDLKYRHLVYKHQKSQGPFLNSIPHRVQEYGTAYRTAVSDLGLLIESLANYLRDISSTCNSAGSALWASTKNIKPLIDANCHIEAIELANDRSRIQLSPIFYKNPASNSGSPTSQTILFGWGPELRTDGQQKKVLPILEYLLHPLSPRSVINPPFHIFRYWPLINKIEQAWTGEEELDRALLSKYDVVTRHCLIEIYLETLPEPVVSYEELKGIGDASVESLRMVWNSWSQDPIKATILRTLLPHMVRYSFMFDAFCQKSLPVFSGVIDTVLELANHPEIWRSPISDVQQEGTSSSRYALAGRATVTPGGA